MSAKGFTFLLVGVLALGLVLGGGLVVVAALAQTEEETTPVASSLPRSGSSGQVVAAAATDSPTLDQLREQIQSGEVTLDDLAQFQQQFQGRQFGQGGRRLGGALTGAVQSVSGNTVTVDTSEGSLQATVGENTTIQQTIEVALADLTLGARVNVGGVRGEDGTFLAQTIAVVPESQQGPGGFGGGQLRQEDLTQFRQQFQGQFGQEGGAISGGGGGVGGRGAFGDRTAGGSGSGGLSGTIESVDGNTIMVNTDQGSLPVAVGEDTTIQKTVEVTLADLTEGTRVSIVGARNESGDVEARAIIVIPEGQEDGFLGGFGRWFRGGGGFEQLQP